MASRVTVTSLTLGAVLPNIAPPPVLPAARVLLTAAGPHRLSPLQNAPMSASPRMNTRDRR
jgi:hypothetical protein